MLKYFIGGVDVRKVLYIKQQNHSDCGLACLLSIIKSYHSNAPLSWLKYVSGWDKSGVSMFGLVKAAKSLGFYAEGNTGEFKEISSNHCPFIAHVILENNLMHYVVVEDINKKTVLIMDPAVGHKRVAYDDFLKILSGNYLFIEKRGYVKTIDMENHYTIILLDFIKKERTNLIFFSIILLLTAFLELLLLFQFKILINNALNWSSFSNLFILVAIFGSLSCFQIAFHFLSNIYCEKIKVRLTRFLQTKFFKHILTLPYLYYKIEPKGVFFSYFNDINILITFLFHLFLFISKNIWLLFFYYCYFFYLSRSFFLLMVLGNLLAFLFLYKAEKRRKRLLNYYYKTKDEYHDCFHQNINNIEMIKGLHLEKIRCKLFNKYLVKFNKSNYDIQFQIKKEQSILFLLEKIIYFFMIILGGIEVIKSNYDLGTFILLEGFIWNVLQSSETFFSLFINYGDYKEAKSRFNEIFYIKEEKMIKSNLAIDYDNLDINVENLSFEYHDKTILKSISWKIKPNQKVFLFGKSGSGKSTLVRIIGRYLDIPYGMVQINNMDITHYNLDSLREIITYSSISEELVSGTIYDNLVLGRNVHFSTLKKVLWITGFTEVMNNKKIALDTNLMLVGINLSAGELSRLFLARALLKKSKVYIFDELLSNLDIHSERIILTRIFKEYKNSIIIYISHRLNCQDMFDAIYKLQKGKLYKNERTE